REAGGIFGANFRLAILMNLVIQAFRYAAEPFFFQQANNKNNPQTFSRVMHWFIICCSLLMVAISVNLHIIGPLFLRGEGYELGLKIVPILLLGYLFLGIYFNLSIWFKLTDQTRYSFYITLIAVIGFTGAVFSTLLSYLAMSIVCYILGQKYYPIPYRTGRGIFYLVTASVFGFLGFFLEWEDALVNFLARNAFVLAYVIIIVLMEKKELYLILNSLLGNKRHANSSN